VEINDGRDQPSGRRVARRAAPASRLVRSSLLVGLLALALWQVGSLQVAPNEPEQATASAVPGGPDAGRPAAAALRRLADWLEAGDRDHRVLAQVERDLVTAVPSGGYVPFVVQGALVFVKGLQGVPVAPFKDEGQQAMYDYIFGRGEASAADYLRGWTQEGAPGEAAIFGQVGGGFFCASRGADWIEFLQPLELRGRKVCDLGGGIGYLSWMLAERYGPSTVYLADIDATAFEFVEFAARRPGFRALARVKCHEVPLPGSRPGLPEPVDVILMSDVHAARDPDYEARGRILLENLANELRPGGVIAIHEGWFEQGRQVPFEEIEEAVTARLEECGYDVLRADHGQQPSTRHTWDYNIYARPKAFAGMPNTLVRVK